MPKKISHIGVKFGNLLVVSKTTIQTYGNGEYLYSCICDCGKIVLKSIGNLRSGATKSCGCMIRILISKHKTRHGFAKDGQRSKVYRTWAQMRNRCSNPNNPSFKNYGGRGIRVCERWNSFENFRDDMGIPEPHQSIERINNNLDYSPDNCRWATMADQMRNTRANRVFTINGITGCATDLAKHFGISLPGVLLRIDRYGWTPHEAFTVRPHAGRHKP